MHPIHAGQIKAARAFLDWSQEDLAQATGLSITTIRNLEMGGISPRSSTNSIIRQVIENSGLELIDSDGVKRCRDDVKTYGGRGCCEAFFEDMLRTLLKKGGDVLCSIRSQEMMMRSCGVPRRDGPDPLQQLAAISNVRCLLSGTFAPSLLPSFQFRAISRLHAGPIPYYVYGDKQALVLLDGNIGFKFVVLKSASWAQECRQHFTALWDTATPLLAQESHERTVHVGLSHFLLSDATGWSASKSVRWNCRKRQFSFICRKTAASLMKSAGNNPCVFPVVSGIFAHLTYHP